MSTKPENINTSSERVKEIMGAAIHDEGHDASPEDYTQAAIEALKAAGYAIVPRKIPNEMALAFKKAAEDYMTGGLGFIAIHDGWEAAIKAAGE